MTVTLDEATAALVRALKKKFFFKSNGQALRAMVAAYAEADQQFEEAARLNGAAPQDDFESLVARLCRAAIRNPGLPNCEAIVTLLREMTKARKNAEREGLERFRQARMAERAAKRHA